MSDLRRPCFAWWFKRLAPSLDRGGAGGHREALVSGLRVVRPGGQLRLYEHVRAPSPLLAATQDRFDPLWSRIAGGCHTGRDPLAAARESGFELDWVRRFRFPARGLTVPLSPHVLAGATRTR